MADQLRLYTLDIATRLDHDKGKQCGGVTRVYNRYDPDQDYYDEPCNQLAVWNIRTEVRHGSIDASVHATSRDYCSMHIPKKHRRRGFKLELLG